MRNLISNMDIHTWSYGNNKEGIYVLVKILDKNKYRDTVTNNNI